MPEIEKKEIHIFYILDTSGSMTGLSIGQVNRTMSETLSDLKQIAKKITNTDFKIAILSFNSACEWITGESLVDLNSFEWEDLSEGVLSDIGLALTELNNKISNGNFCETISDDYSPFFVFMTDGLVTDDYSKSLGEVKQKKWFINGTKIGFEVGDDSDKQTIADIVGGEENIIKTKDLDKFAIMVKKGCTS